MIKFLLLTICMLLTVNCIAPIYIQVDVCTVQCPVDNGNVGKYFDSDHFSWTNPSDQIHLAAGLAGSLIIGEFIHHYTHIPAWQAAIIGSLAMGIVGTTKETLFDTYTSRTDITCWWVGGITGGLTLIVLHF